MFKAVLKKFQTHPELKVKLLNTLNAEIVEGSINDYFWGCGQDGTGQNELGKIIMKVRKEFKNNAA